MKKDYRDQVLQHLNLDEDGIQKMLNHLDIKEIPSGTILLSEGETARKLFLVVRGCLRGYFIKENGIEITSQFFIEGHVVSSFESAMTKSPSRMCIDAIEDSVVGSIQMKHLEHVIRECDSVREYFKGYLMSRLIYYMNQHASFILDSPEQRYVKLVQENPELISRLPQHHIASYLGITPVSLSRIRSRIKKQINNC